MTNEPAPPDRAARDALIGAIMGFLEGQDPLALGEARGALEREIDEAGPGALVGLKDRLTDVESSWDYSPPDPLARRLHHILTDRFLRQDSELLGIENVTAVSGRPVVIVPNHLSYADANLVEMLLQRFGGSALADRLTTLAGPKVFSSRTRRFSSLCFGTIRTPQSAEVSSGEAVMDAREVARAARRSIDAARHRLASGDALLVFGEGTRSRTGGMQQLLAGVTRYFGDPGTWVLPAGIVGTEALFPIGEKTIHQVRVVVRVGQPLDAALLRVGSAANRRVWADAVGLAIAELLPPKYRGVYREDAGRYAEARRVLSDSR